MFDKSLISVNFSSDFVDLHFNLYHRVNLVIGGSGSNKSHFVQAISDAIEDNDFSIDGYNIIFVRDGNASSPASIDDSAFVIIDDLKSVLYSKKFSEYQKKAKNMVFLIVLRDTFYFDDVYSCFSEAVYNIRYSEKAVDGVLKECFELSSYMDKFVETNTEGIIGMFDTCIIEGSEGKGEYNFYSKIFKNVIPSKGKDNIVNNIKECSSKYVYVAIDWCSFGTNVYELICVISSSDSIFIFLNSYSFEYLMLEACFPEKFKYFQENYSFGDVGFEKIVSGYLIKLKYSLKGRFVNKNIPRCLLYECSDICSNVEIDKCYKSSMLKCLNDRFLDMSKNSSEIQFMFKISSNGGKLC